MNLLRIFIVLFLLIPVLSCSSRKMQPGEPRLDPIPESPAPAPEPSQVPEPEPPPEKTPTAPPILKPRAQSPADPASVKLVESGIKEMNAGRLEEAEQYFEQALRVSPTNGKPYYYLGVLFAKQKDYSRSLSFLEQAEIYLGTSDFWMSQVYLQEALAYKALRKTAEARARLQLSLQRDPSNEWATRELNALSP